MNQAIVRAAIRFRLLVILGAAAVAIAGVMALRGTPVDVLPEFGAPTVEIQTESLGLSAPEVEQLITVPMEQELLNGVKGVETVRSDSISGLSVIDLTFAPGTSILDDRQLVQERLAQTGVLPNVAQPPQMLQPVSSTPRALMIGLGSRRLTPIQLSVLARWTIRPRLMGLPGVANVAIWGERDRQLQVLVDPRRLRSHDATLSQVVATTGNAQLVSPLTYLNASTPGTGGFIDGPNQRLSITHVLPFGRPANLARVPVAGAGDLQLGDVATVVTGHQPLIGDALFDGRHGLLLVVEKRPGASTLGVTHEVESALADLRAGLPGVQIDTHVFRPATFIDSAVDHLGVIAIVAAALVLAALAAFLRSWRAILVGAVAIPISLLAAILALRLLGYSANALLVAGLVMALALVVDDALAASAGVLRRLREQRRVNGEGSADASVGAAVGELRAPLAYATLMILAAAVPVLVASGRSASYVRPLALAYATSVVASTAVALTLTPALAALLFRRPPPLPRAAGGRFGLRLRGRVDGLVARAIGMPRGALAAIFAAGLAAVAAVPFLGPPSRPSFRDRDIVVHSRAAPGASLRRMNRTSARLQAALRSVPGVRDVASDVGRAVLGDRIVGANSAETWVTLAPGADYDATVAAIRRAAASVPGASSRVTNYENEASAGVLSAPHRALDVRVYGERYRVLEREAARLRGRLAQVAGLGPAHVPGLPVEQPGVRIQVHLRSAMRHGLTPGEVRRQVATVVAGLVVGNFFEQQKVFDVVVRGDARARDSFASVRGLVLDTPGGGHVRLDRVAAVRVVREPADIRHDSVSRYVDVRAPVRGDAGEVRAAAAATIQRTSFPLGYHAEVLGATSAGEATSHTELMAFAAAAAVAILLLFQAAFGSWRLALALTVALPVAAVGALLVALIQGTAGSLGTAAGYVAVVGLAARQWVLLVARIQARQRGAPAGAAAPVLEATRERLGPTAGGALAAALALAPFAFAGQIAGNEITAPLASAVIGGLASATLLTLFVVPAICARVGPSQPAAPVLEEPERRREPEAALLAGGDR
jgi:Cu/Ag efflux pump CusA